MEEALQAMAIYPGFFYLALQAIFVVMAAGVVFSAVGAIRRATSE